VGAGYGEQRSPVAAQKGSLEGARARDSPGRRFDPVDLSPEAGVRCTQGRRQRRVNMIQLAHLERAVDEPGGRRHGDGEEQDGEADEPKSNPQTTRLLTHELRVANP
jgi:hypothetical protein